MCPFPRVRVHRNRHGGGPQPSLARVPRRPGGTHGGGRQQASPPRVARPRSTRRGTTSLLVAIALVATACSSPSDDVVTRQELEDLQAQVAALESRGNERDEALDALQTTTRQLERDDPLTRLNETDEQLAQLAAALSVLEEELAIDRELRAEADEAAAGTIAELQAADGDLQQAVSDARSEVAASRGRIDELAGEVADLRTLYTTLRERFDRLQRGG